MLIDDSREVQNARDRIDEAICNLAEYKGISDVLGPVLRARAGVTDPACAILNLLTNKSQILELLNEDCEVFVRELGIVNAQRKCKTELLGQIGQVARKFNGFCGDFWAEMAAIRELGKNGYSGFVPVFKTQADGTTNDYQATWKGYVANVEVKNIRSNETVLDVFAREIGRLYQTDPHDFAFSIGITYPFDNPHTASQERAIRQFVGNLRGRTVPFVEMLDLDDAVATIKVTDGMGTAFMSRSIGSTSPEPLDKEKFLLKVKQKAEEAAGQMRNSAALKVLVINFDSPSGSISDKFVREAKDVMRAAFTDEVRPYFLLYRYAL